jgi:WD40 repeat protein
LAFAPTGVLASGGNDRTLRYWDVATGQLTATLSVGNVPTSLTFGPDGQLHWADRETFGFSTVSRVHTSSTRFQAHASSVMQIRHCQKGLLTASADGTLKLWQYWSDRTLPEAAVARGEFGAVLSFGVSTGEDQVVAGYADGRVRIWELREPPQRALGSNAAQSVAFIGGERRLVNGHAVFDFSLTKVSPVRTDLQTRPVGALAVHPAGRRLAFSRDDGTVYLWDLKQKGELVHWSAHGQRVRGLASSPDGQRLASVSADGMVRLWDWETGRVVHTLTPGLGELHAVAWSRVGQYLAATGVHGVAVWNLDDTAKPLWTSAHSLSVSGLALGTDSLAVSGPENTAEILDLRTGQKRRTLRGHTAAVSALEFSPDSARLASGSAESSVRLWDPATGQEVAKFEHPGLLNNCLAFDPQGRYLLAENLVCDLRTNQVAAHLDIGYGSASGRFTADGSALLLGTYSGSVASWPVAQIEQARAEAKGPAAGAAPAGPVRISHATVVVPGGHLEAIWGVAASPDGRWLATASHDRTVKLWNARTLKLVRTLEGHSAVVWCVAFSPDSQTLASGSATDKEGEIKVWDVASGRQRWHFTGHGRLVVGLAFHPAHPWLVSCANDGSVRFWDVAAGRDLGLVHQFDQSVHGLAFRPDGRWLAVACEDHHVALWQVGEAPPLAKPPARLLQGHTAAVWGVGFSADGRYLASGADQGTIILWDSDTFARVVRLRGGRGQVRSISFSRDGELLAGGTYFNPAIVWDLPKLRRSLREMNLDW